MKPSKCIGNLNIGKEVLHCHFEMMHDGMCRADTSNGDSWAWPSPKMGINRVIREENAIPYVRDRDTSDDDILRDAGRGLWQ